MSLENIKKKLEQRCIELKSANIYNEEQYEECLKNVFRKDFYENTSNEPNVVNSEVVLDENTEKSNKYWNNILSDKLVSKHVDDVTFKEYLELKDKRKGIDEALLDSHKEHEDNQFTKLRHYYNEVDTNRDILDKIENNITKLDKIKSIEDIKLENSSYTILLSFVIIFIIIAIILIIAYFKF